MIVIAFERFWGMLCLNKRYKFVFNVYSTI